MPVCPLLRSSIAAAVDSPSKHAHIQGHPIQNRHFVIHTLGHAHCRYDIRGGIELYREIYRPLTTPRNNSANVESPSRRTEARRTICLARVSLQDATTTIIVAATRQKNTTRPYTIGRSGGINHWIIRSFEKLQMTLREERAIAENRPSTREFSFKSTAQEFGETGSGLCRGSL